MKKVMALTTEEQATLTEYAELKAAEKELAKKIEDKAAAVMGLLYKHDVEEIGSPFGKFTLEARKQWKYPEAVNALAEAFDKAKTEAQQKGTATFEAKPYVKFYPTRTTNSA